MSEPIAYFITISSYGARLHGDERGTARRIWQADPGGRRVEVNALRVQSERAQMKHESPHFGAVHRGTISRAIREVCAHRGWRLHALNARTNHVHIVVSCSGPPEAAMNSFKAWATRQLREEGLAAAEDRIWARHGSTRYLWDERGVAEVILYVKHRQGVDLSEA